MEFEPVFKPWMSLILAGIIFVIGLTGVLFRKNLLVTLMGIELMLNAATMTFVGFAKIHQNLDGELSAILIMAVAAAESAVGLALVITLFRTLKTVNSDSIQMLRD